MRQFEPVDFKIRANDLVQIISGREKGKAGRVVRLFPKSGRVLVEGANLAVKHRKKRQGEQEGAIETKPMSIHSSNVMLYCETCSRGVKFKVSPALVKKGPKVRICKKCNSEFGAGSAQQA